jgi:two-component system, LuxR family, response regulator FixJ
MKALVIEDNWLVRETIGFVLECRNFKVELAEDAEQALRCLRRKWPDLLILDLVLPGLDGKQFYREVRSRFGHAPPTVVFSGTSDGLEHAGEMPGAWFLPKTSTVDELEQVIAEALDRRGDATLLH